MLSRRTLFVLSTSILLKQSTASLSAAEITQIVADHNTARRTLTTWKGVQYGPATNMLEMIWDPILAQTAQNYLASLGSCSNFQHNANRLQNYLSLGGTHASQTGVDSNTAYVGENWYSGGATTITDPAITATNGDTFGGGAVTAWTTGNCFGYSSGGSGYTCTAPVCSEAAAFFQVGTSSDGSTQCNQSNGQTEVGHFTQVMAWQSQYVGCGYTAACGTLCDYAPGGNFNQPNPVTPASVWGVGTLASACPSYASVNDNGLCSTSASTGTTAVSSGTTAVVNPTTITATTTRPATTTRRTTATLTTQNPTTPGVTTTQSSTTTTNKPTTTTIPTTKLSTTITPTTLTPTTTSSTTLLPTTVIPTTPVVITTPVIPTSTVVTTTPPTTKPTTTSGVIATTTLPTTQKGSTTQSSIVPSGTSSSSSSSTTSSSSSSSTTSSSNTYTTSQATASTSIITNVPTGSTSSSSAKPTTLIGSSNRLSVNNISLSTLIPTFLGVVLGLKLRYFS